jgi:hypothetical protein
MRARLELLFNQLIEKSKSPPPRMVCAPSRCGFLPRWYTAAGYLGGLHLSVADAKGTKP